MIATVHPASEPHYSLVTAGRYFAGQTFGDDLASVVKNREWWHDTHRLASTSDEQFARASVLSRDANPDIMNAHLTGRPRSIPVVIALDGNRMEHGWWGPRGDLAAPGGSEAM
ncbi:MAG: thioredoxin family protein, partial [Gemmatimonadaceae bacterium]